MAGVSRAAVVVNPTKIDDQVLFRRHVTTVMRRMGWAEPLWLETTIEDTGRGMVEMAVRSGVDVVFACGGDGTVRACVDGIVNTGVPLAVLPAGTGNLLVRNLALPMIGADAVVAGLTGRTRALDVGRIGDQHFVVMAGLGFDAAMMADAPEALKARVGWPAYIVSGVRHLADRPMTVGLRLDDGERLTRRASTVLIGNVGRLQGGIPLMPDARPDDGVLDVVVIAPRHVADWVRVGASVLARRRGGDRRVERFRARRVEIRTVEDQPVQLDGDPAGSSSRVVAEVQPGALLVRVPRPALR
jgi:YegS/Rv2252/BmrU family lipid kinase